jgi:DNA mismatch endonuclease Vsr
MLMLGRTGQPRRVANVMFRLAWKRGKFSKNFSPTVQCMKRMYVIELSSNFEVTERERRTGSLYDPNQLAWVARMSHIRGEDTKPEVKVRQFAHHLGYRFQVHRRDLPGSPHGCLPTPSCSALTKSSSLHAPMPLSLSGVMFVE